MINMQMNKREEGDIDEERAKCATLMSRGMSHNDNLPLRVMLYE